VTQIPALIESANHRQIAAVSHSPEGRIAIVTNAERGMQWTQVIN
jgi:hypothetical protein